MFCYSNCLTSVSLCAKCSKEMLQDENKANSKLNKEKENELLTEKVNTKSNLSDFDVGLLKLPLVSFLNKNPDVEKENKSYQPKFSDLCLEDKQRIVQLIEEVARYKKEKQEDIYEINSLKNQLREFKEKNKNLKASENSKLLSLYKMEEKYKEEENNLKHKVSELSSLLTEMQNQKDFTNEQVKAIKVQAEKLTEALKKSHNENLFIEKMYMKAKEELNFIKATKQTLTKHTEFKKNIKTKTEDKSCQCFQEELESEKVAANESRPDKKSKCVKEGESSSETSDSEILSELFFTKTSSLQQDEPFLLLQDHATKKYNFNNFFIE